MSTRHDPLTSIALDRSDRRQKEPEMNPDKLHGASASAPSPRSLIPPFTPETALAKVRAAEDAWNSRDPERVSLAYSPESVWRNRDQFIQGRDEIRSFLKEKWDREQEYRLAKALWGFREKPDRCPFSVRVA